MRRFALAGAAMLLAALSGSAHASAAAIVVRGAGGSVAIERDPFRISFRDTAGHTVLEEVAPQAPAVQPVPPVPQSAPLTNEQATAPTLYDPLTFTVGQERSLQFPGTQYVGNMLTSTTAGIRYGARAVVASHRAGAGVRLVLSTSDPSGRQLDLMVAPGPHATFRVTARTSNPAGVAAMADSFASGPGEAFHGFGGRHNALDEHGQDFYNWIEQENTGAGEAGPVVDPLPTAGYDRFLFPNGPTAAYHVESLFVSSRRYGFLLDRDELSRWRMDSDRPDAWQVEVAAPALDYVVAPGSLAHAVGAINAIDGREPVAPAWAVGSLFDREVQFEKETPASYKAHVAQDLADFRKYGLHVDGYRVEGWWYFDDPELRSLFAQMHRRGIHPLVYFRSYADTSGNSGLEDPNAYSEATTHGYAATTATGQPYPFLSNYNEPGVLYDFTNPATRAWWTGRVDHALDLGADGFMQDFGEQTLVDMHFHNGATGASEHNRYPVDYHALTRQIFNSYERRHPHRRLFFYTRSGYSGAPGSDAYDNANFAGDETTDWSRSSGLASLTTDMLNRAIGGAFGYTTDIGGYFDLGPYQATSKELFIRWTEWAALSPFFRLHGSLSAGTHTPWSYDAQTIAIYKRYLALHLKMRPLILALWRQAEKTGIPVTRPLWLAYPGDKAAAQQDQEWLLGPDLLVAPVVTQGARSRDVYLPGGCWQEHGVGRRYRGRRRLSVSAALSDLPYFVRCESRPFASRSRPQHRSGSRR